MSHFKFRWCQSFQTYSKFAVAAVSLACDQVQKEMEQLQIPIATSKVFEDVQLALHHIIRDAAPLAIQTLAKAYNGVQCLPVATRRRLNIRLQECRGTMHASGGMRPGLSSDSYEI